MENYVQEQVTRATSGVQDLRQEFTAQAGQVAEKLSLVDDDLGRVQAQIGAKFELVMQQTVALRLENESLSARLAAFESQHHQQLLSGDPSMSSTPDHSLPVSPSVARICNGAQEDDDLISCITNVPPTSHDGAHIAGTNATGPRWVDNSGKSHCDPPVNFPISFLTSYSPDGFPQREFDFYCAGHLTAEPPVQLLATRALSKTDTLTFPTAYTGLKLTQISPLELIKFWMDRSDYTRMGGVLPVSAAI
jgi:hypothetical protein